MAAGNLTCLQHVINTLPTWQHSMHQLVRSSLSLCGMLPTPRDWLSALRVSSLDPNALRQRAAGCEPAPLSASLGPWGRRSSGLPALRALAQRSQRLRTSARCMSELARARWFSSLARRLRTAARARWRANRIGSQRVNEPIARCVRLMSRTRASCILQRAQIFRILTSGSLLSCIRRV
jgi:hypothetical protein